MSTHRVRVVDQGEGWPLSVRAVEGALDPTPVRVEGVDDQSLVRVRLDEVAVSASDPDEAYRALLVLHVEGRRTVGPLGWGIPVYFLTSYPSADQPLDRQPWPACRARVEPAGE